MKTLRIPILISLMTLLVPSLITARERTESAVPKVTKQTVPRPPAKGPLGAIPLLSSSVIDTFVVAEYGFEVGGSNCDAQGWYSVDRTVHPGIRFHVDDFSGLGGGSFGRLNPLQGAQSLWCGVRADSTDDLFCSYGSLPGYGNNWSQYFESVALPFEGNVGLAYMIRWDSESNYDYTYVEYADTNGDWIELASYTGVGTAFETWVIDENALPDSVRVRFRFESDGGASDQDNLLNTDGAVIIDALLVADTVGVLAYQDFESEMVGDLVTMDGVWRAVGGPGYGDFAALFPGTQVLQEDDCINNSSCMWGFFQGSQYDYSCGGHPGQLAVPYGNNQGQYIDNEIWSPWIDWTQDQDGTPIPDTAWIGYLEYDVYADLPLDALVFHQWHVRSKTDGGCPTEWSGDGFVHHGPDEPEWRLGWRGRRLVSVLIPPDATEIQVAIGAVDRCEFWCGSIGSGDCHSHAPLIDNVRLIRLDPAGPVWSQSGLSGTHDVSMLFQDNFPEIADYTRPGTGEFTAMGKVRVDIGLDISDGFDPNILPGDSLVINVTDVIVGLDRDVGGGPAVYIHVKDLPGKSGAVLSGGSRWPYAPSVSGGGWTAVRMDSITPLSYPESRFCVDLNDNLYEAGDTVLYYLSARNNDGVTTYWSEHTGQTSSEWAARAYPMEMTCLPANALTPGISDILIVYAHDDASGRQYLDFDFEQLGIKADRFDIQRNSLTINNGLASRVKDVTEQLIPYYKGIIWSSGNRVELMIGDGSLPKHKSNDFELLYQFLDLHHDDCGVYLTGDNLAGEWRGKFVQSAVDFRITFMDFDVASDDHFSIGEPRSPLVVSQDPSVFEPDSMIAFGYCPVIRGFDVLTPAGSSVMEMAYSDNPARGAVLSNSTPNSMAQSAQVVLSGFGYDAIRDDRAVSPHDRIVHLHAVLQWMTNNYIPDPTGTQSPTFENGLAQNYPNPFNPTTTIRYSTRERVHVTIRVYNVAGQLVRSLVDGTKNPGPHQVTWDGLSNAGDPVSSGVYFYRLVSGGFTQTKKMVVLK